MLQGPAISDITTLVLLALLVVLVLSGVLLFRMVAQPERRLTSVEGALVDVKSDLAIVKTGLARVERNVQRIFDAAMEKGLRE